MRVLSIFASFHDQGKIFFARRVRLDTTVSATAFIGSLIVVTQDQFGHEYFWKNVGVFGKESVWTNMSKQNNELYQHTAWALHEPGCVRRVFRPLWGSVCCSKSEQPTDSEWLEIPNLCLQLGTENWPVVQLELEGLNSEKRVALL